GAPDQARCGEISWPFGTPMFPEYCAAGHSWPCVTVVDVTLNSSTSSSRANCSLPIRAGSLMSTMLLLLRCRPCLYVHQPSGDGQEEARVGFLPSRASFYSVCCGLFFLQAVSESFGLVFEIIGGIFDLISGVFDFALQVLALAFTFSLLITGGFTSGFF